MDDIFQLAKQRQHEAWTVIEDTDVMNIWSSMGATINLVGSLKTGLLINNRDIDFHIYTDPFNLADSFSAMSKLAENKGIKKISYTNLLDADDKCIEWHALYDDQGGNTWQIDMIHILNGSPFVGYFENVAERISAVLTHELQEAILKIKNAIPMDQKVMSIQIYQAVIADGVRSIEEFCRWKEQNTTDGIIQWMP